MLGMALHLRDQELSLREIAARLVITKGDKKGQHPSPPTVMRMLREPRTVRLAVVALGNGNATTGSGDAAPRSQSTVRYPIRFDNTPPPRIVQPRATVSYPVRFPEAEGAR
ncbi:hypothetical protein ACIP4Q_28585 [Streptomyces massasporeus]